MANPEHVEILKQGVKVWNEWRTQNNTFWPDLRLAKLRRANLAEANLAGANLTEADLTGANLTEANVTGANVTDAKLTGVKLTHANLAHAHLVGANFSAADLRGAILDMASLLDTVFVDTNLTGVQSLDTCRHLGPSIIDHRTLTKSGILPLSFLRGCGLPDQFIDYIPSLFNQAVQFYSVFVSHSSVDGGFATRLHNDLQNAGVRCWFAPEDLKIGDRFRLHIDESIRTHDKLLLVLSENAIASAWVETEVEAAFERERREKRTVVFPVRVDDAVMETQAAWASDIRRTRHIGDFSRWKDYDQYKKAFDRLLRDLKAQAATK